MKIKNLFIFALLTLVVASCSKEITLDIAEGEQRIVVDAEVIYDYEDTTALTLIAKLTRTNGFYGTNLFDSIENAQVEMQDEEGNIYPLIHISGGKYQTYVNIDSYQSGKNFTMKATVDGETISAQSAMPSPVKLDSLWAIVLPYGPPDHQYPTPIAFFNDIPNEKNFYKLTLFVNNVLKIGGAVAADVGYDGQLIPYPMFGIEIYPGDDIIVELEAISEQTYDYYQILNQMAGGSFVAAPGNPSSNILGNALGVMSAHSSDTLHLKVK